MGGFRWVCFFGGVDWPGLCGRGGGWTGMTNSSPDWSESLSDSEIGRSFEDAWFFFASFTGNSFIEFHIMGNFNALVGCIPELVSFGARFVTNEDHFSAFWLKFGSPLF